MKPTMKQRLQATLTNLSERAGLGLRPVTGDNLCLCVKRRGETREYSYAIIDPTRPHGKRVVESGRGAMDNVLAQFATAVRARELTEQIIKQTVSQIKTETAK